MVKPIPDGMRSLTPFITSNDPDRMVNFITKAIGGEVVFNHKGPNGKTMHAQIRIGDSIVMVGDAMGKNEMNGMIYVYTKDVDALYKQAMANGAKDTMGPPQDMFYGDRMTNVLDPQGGMWCLATHIEDVSMEELTRRTEKMCANAA